VGDQRRARRRAQERQGRGHDELGERRRREGGVTTACRGERGAQPVNEGFTERTERDEHRGPGRGPDEVRARRMQAGPARQGAAALGRWKLPVLCHAAPRW
jgi:hypothetical protein